MKDEQKSVCLETAKKLKATGWDKETERKWAKQVQANWSMFRNPVWQPIEGKEPFIELGEREGGLNDDPDYMTLEWWSAPDAQEILEVLQEAEIKFDISYFQEGRDYYGEYYVDGKPSISFCYERENCNSCKNKKTEWYSEAHENLAELLAMFWLWLKGRDLI